MATTNGKVRPGARVIRRPLSRATVLRAEALLREGLGLDAVAARLRIGCGSVRRIRDGEHAMSSASTRLPRRRRSSATVNADADGIPSPYQEAEPYCCSGCEAAGVRHTMTVLRPCPACTAREMLLRNGGRRLTTREQAPALQLAEAEAEGVAEVHAQWREEAMAAGATPAPEGPDPDWP